jgi:TatD DNase family protein
VTAWLRPPAPTAAGRRRLYALVVFVDAHVHVDRYRRPPEVLAAAEAARVVCVAVTETPKDFELLSVRAGRRFGLRVALGAHPMRAATLDLRQLERFTALLPRAEYVGEIGLDGSREGRASLPAQRRVFAHVLGAPGIRQRVLSVHSRGAEAEAITALEDAGVTAVLHWYTGALKHADRALNAGIYFSVNAAMLRSKKGARLLRAIPRNRVLTETDGPYVATGSRPSAPSDVPGLVRDLAGVWGCDPEEARSVVWENMAAVYARARGDAADDNDQTGGPRLAV